MDPTTQAQPFSFTTKTAQTSAKSGKFREASYNIYIYIYIYIIYVYIIAYSPKPMSENSRILPKA